MKYSNKSLPAAASLIAVALLAAILGGSATSAQPAGAADPTRRDERVFFRLSDEAQPDGFEAAMQGNKIVGMTVVMKDGSRTDLKPQSKPTGASNCEKGETLTCWEDEKEMMSVCVCGTALSGIPLAKPIVGVAAKVKRRYDIVGAFPKKLE